MVTIMMMVKMMMMMAHMACLPIAATMTNTRRLYKFRLTSGKIVYLTLASVAARVNRTPSLMRPENMYAIKKLYMCQVAPDRLKLVVNPPVKRPAANVRSA